MIAACYCEAFPLPEEDPQERTDFDILLQRTIRRDQKNDQIFIITFEARITKDNIQQLGSESQQIISSLNIMDFSITSSSIVQICKEEENRLKDKWPKQQQKPYLTTMIKMVMATFSLNRCSNSQKTQVDRQIQLRNYHLKFYQEISQKWQTRMGIIRYRCLSWLNLSQRYSRPNYGLDFYNLNSAFTVNAFPYIVLDLINFVKLLIHQKRCSVLAYQQDFNNKMKTEDQKRCSLEQLGKKAEQEIYRYLHQQIQTQPSSQSPKLSLPEIQQKFVRRPRYSLDVKIPQVQQPERKKLSPMLRFMSQRRLKRFEQDKEDEEPQYQSFKKFTIHTISLKKIEPHVNKPITLPKVKKRYFQLMQKKQKVLFHPEQIMAKKLQIDKKHQIIKQALQFQQIKRSRSRIINSLPRNNQISGWNTHQSKEQQDNLYSDITILT